MARRPHLYGLAAIMLFSLVLNLAFNKWGLPKLWHPDEVVRRVLSMHARGSLNPDFFAYPSLHLYTVIFLILEPYEAWRRLTGASFAAVDIHWLARCLSAVMGALTVLMVYLVARFFGGRKAGLWAALCLACSVGFVGFAHFATVDIPLCFWMTTAFYACLRALRSPGWGRSAVAGLLVGLAASTKYVGILLVGPLLLGLVWVKCSERDGRSLRSHLLNPRYPAALLGVVTGFLLGTPYALLAFPDFLAEFIMLMIYQPDYAGGSTLGFMPHLAHLVNQMGVFLFAAAAAGFLGLAWTGIRKKSVCRVVLVLTILLVYFKMGSMHFHPGRYIVVLVPLLAVCAGWLLASMSEWVSRRTAPLRVAWAMLLTLGMLYTLGYLGAGLWQIKHNDRARARAWVQEHVPPDARVKISQTYAFEFSPSYTNTGRFPHVHRKETFDRMYEHPLYLFCREHLPWLGLASAPPPARWQEGAYDGSWLEVLLAEKPDYLVLSEGDFGRFLDSAAGAREAFPRQNELYEALLSGDTPYHLAADFRDHYTWYWPELEFINTGIVIFEYEAD